MSRESMMSIKTIDDIKSSLPERLVTILEGNNVDDVASWELAQFIIREKKWGEFVTLSSDEESGLRQGKYVEILGENIFRVETFTREEIISK